jgi:hypothetical protein
MRKMPHYVFGSANSGATKRILIMQIFLNEEQTALVRSAAASIDPCWHQRFLASVQDELLGHNPSHVTNDDVLAALESVRWAMFEGTIDDDD